ncbi:tetratricopeptide repeat protein, partial [Microvirga sp. 0TCS3.31]
MQDKIQACLKHARQARSRGDRAAALEHLRAALVIDPAQISLKVEIAAVLRELGQLDEAEAALQEIIAQAPQHFGTLAELGRVARKRGDRAAALNRLQAAAALDFANLPVRLEIAAVLRELGQLDEAEAALQEIIAQAP